MFSFITKLILVITLISTAFSSDIESEILLSLERIKLQNEILYNQYEDLKEIESKIDPANYDKIIDSITQKVISDIESHSKYKKNSAWGEVKELVHHISDETKVLTRKNGLAISIVIMTIELTEIPMKALAVSIGSPILIVLYEVLQPGILVPTIIIGIQNIVKNRKIKKLFGDKELYKAWRDSEKQIKKKLKIKKGKNQISYVFGDNNYIIDNSNLLSDSLRIIGFNKKRLDYKNLKIFMRKRKIKAMKIDMIINTGLHKQLKAKLILDELIKLGYINELAQKFHKARVDLAPRDLNPEIAKWTFELLQSESQEKTKSLFNNLPTSMNPLLFFELWEAKIMEEFFSYNNQFKRRYYRSLKTRLLPLIIKLRKEAFITGIAPAWNDKLINFSKNYFMALGK